MSWTAILVLAAGTYSAKLIGVLGGTWLQNRTLRSMVQLIPPSLLCALVVVQTFDAEGSLALDARVVGLAVAVGATLARVPFIGVIALAMAATAGARLVGM